jgi:hypothetical protein
LNLPERISAIRVDPPLAFLGIGLSGVAVVDISSPDRPALKSIVKLAGQTTGVSSVGNRVLASNVMSGVELIDVSVPTAPKPLGPFFTEGYARDVTVLDSFAYIIDLPTGFSIVEVPRNGPLTTATAIDQSAQNPVAVAASNDLVPGKRLACVVNGRGVMFVYDVTDPAKPRKTATFKTPGRATRLAVGSFVYVADGGPGLQVISLSNPEAPVITTTYATEGPARDVAAAGGLVVVVSGMPGVATILK